RQHWQTEPPGGVDVMCNSIFTRAIAWRLLAVAGGLGTAAGAAGNESGGALFTAVRNEDRAAVAALLREKGDVNAREEDGATPLAWAALRCNREIAGLLLKAGANPNLTNEQGVGPFYVALTNGCVEIAKLLLENRAGPNMAREDGETPL